MALQFQNFTPNDQKHFTLAETQSEKEAEMSRQMARDAANNAAESANRAMSVDSSNQQHAMSLAQNAKQAGVENGLNQQRINSDNTRVGLANAREMEKTRADVAQNDIANKRQAFADQNTLQQQGLTNARAEKEDQRNNIVWNRANDFAAKTNDLSNIYSNLQNMSPNKDGFYNLNHAYDSVNAQVYGDLPKGNIQGKLNAQGGMDVYADGVLHLVDGTNSISLPVQAMKLAHDIVANGGKAPSESDRYKNYSTVDAATGEKTQGLWDTVTRKPVDTSSQPSNELAALNATKETNKNTDAPVVNSDKVNALTGQTPAVQADNSGGLSAARNNDAIDGRDNMFKTVNNGVTTFSNKPPPSAPAPAQVQGLAGQGPAPAVNNQPITNQLLSEKQAQAEQRSHDSQLAKQQYNEALRTISHLSNDSNLSPAEQDQLANAKQFKDKYLRSANNVQ